MSFLDKIENFLHDLKKKWLTFLAKHKWTKYWLEKYLLTQKRNPNPTANRKKSATLLVIMLICLSSLIVGRLLYVGVVKKVDNVSLSEKTRQLYQGEKDIVAKRGTIYDRNGIAIAEDATRYSAYAVLDKNYISTNQEKLYVQKKDISEIARIFKKYLKIDTKYTKKQLGKKLKQVEFGTKGTGITLETRNKIQKELKKAGIKGIYFYEHQDRMYPNGVFASHLIGYAQPETIKGQNTQELVGVMGIEAAYNKELSGTNGKEVFQQDGSGLSIPGTNVVSKKAKNGEDIYTTLDANLQVYLESLMTKIAKEYKPETMEVTIMKAKTGEILATSQRPTFNPETKAGLQSTSKDKNEDKDSAKWRNLLVQEVYEPGSVMKVFTTAAAMQTGVFNGSEYFQAGTTNVDGQEINDWDYYAPKTLNYAQALYHSSNVGMIKLQQKMGDQWESYVKKFGFLKSTDSKLPGELAGTANFTTNVDKAMTSFGQAISVTPMQILQASTTLANKGNMLKPMYISKITNPNTDETVKMNSKIIAHPISEATAEQLLNIMVNTAEDQTLGTGLEYKLNNYKSSVKTGTAQIFENGRYSLVEGDFLYSVLQYAPTENPEYIVYGFIKRPDVTKGLGAAKILSEVTNPLMERALELDSNASKYKINNQSNN